MLAMWTSISRALTIVIVITSVPNVLSSTCNTESLDAGCSCTTAQQGAWCGDGNQNYDSQCITTQCRPTCNTNQYVTDCKCNFADSGSYCHSDLHQFCTMENSMVCRSSCYSESGFSGYADYQSSGTWIDPCSCQFTQVYLDPNDPSSGLVAYQKCRYTTDYCLSDECGDISHSYASYCEPGDGESNNVCLPSCQHDFWLEDCSCTFADPISHDSYTSDRGATMNKATIHGWDVDYHSAFTADGWFDLDQTYITSYCWQGSVIYKCPSPNSESQSFNPSIHTDCECLWSDFGSQCAPNTVTLAYTIEYKCTYLGYGEGVECLPVCHEDKRTGNCNCDFADDGALCSSSQDPLAKCIEGSCYNVCVDDEYLSDCECLFSTPGTYCSEDGSYRCHQDDGEAPTCRRVCSATFTEESSSCECTFAADQTKYSVDPYEICQGSVRVTKCQVLASNNAASLPLNFKQCQCKYAENWSRCGAFGLGFSGVKLCELQEQQPQCYIQCNSQSSFNGDLGCTCRRSTVSFALCDDTPRSRCMGPAVGDVLQTCVPLCNFQAGVPNCRCLSNDQANTEQYQDPEAVYGFCNEEMTSRCLDTVCVPVCVVGSDVEDCNCLYAEEGAKCQIEGVAGRCMGEGDWDPDFGYGRECVPVCKNEILLDGCSCKYATAGTTCMPQNEGATMSRCHSQSGDMVCLDVCNSATYLPGCQCTYALTFGSSARCSSASNLEVCHSDHQCRPVCNYNLAVQVPIANCKCSYATARAACPDPYTVDGSQYSECSSANVCEPVCQISSGAATSNCVCTNAPDSAVCPAAALSQCIQGSCVPTCLLAVSRPTCSCRFSVDEADCTPTSGPNSRCIANVCVPICVKNSYLDGCSCVYSEAQAWAAAGGTVLCEQRGLQLVPTPVCQGSLGESPVSGCTCTYSFVGAACQSEQYPDAASICHATAIDQCIPVCNSDGFVDGCLCTHANDGSVCQDDSNKFKCLDGLCKKVCQPDEYSVACSCVFANDHDICGLNANSLCENHLCQPVCFTDGYAPGCSCTFANPSSVCSPEPQSACEAVDPTKPPVCTPVCVAGDAKVTGCSCQFAEDFANCGDSPIKQCETSSCVLRCSPEFSTECSCKKALDGSHCADLGAAKCELEKCVPVCDASQHVESCSCTYAELQAKCSSAGADEAICHEGQICKKVCQTTKYVTDCSCVFSTAQAQCAAVNPAIPAGSRCESINNALLCTPVCHASSFVPDCSCTYATDGNLCAENGSSRCLSSKCVPVCAGVALVASCSCAFSAEKAWCSAAGNSVCQDSKCTPVCSAVAVVPSCSCKYSRSEAVCNLDWTAKCEGQPLTCRNVCQVDRNVDGCSCQFAAQQAKCGTDKNCDSKACISTCALKYSVPDCVCQFSQAGAWCAVGGGSRCSSSQACVPVCQDESYITGCSCSYANDGVPCDGVRNSTCAKGVCVPPKQVVVDIQFQTSITLDISFGFYANATQSLKDAIAAGLSLDIRLTFELPSTANIELSFREGSIVADVKITGQVSVDETDSSRFADPKLFAAGASLAKSTNYRNALVAAGVPSQLLQTKSVTFVGDAVVGVVVTQGPTPSPSMAVYLSAGRVQSTIFVAISALLSLLIL